MPDGISSEADYRVFQLAGKLQLLQQILQSLIYLDMAGDICLGVFGHIQSHSRMYAGRDIFSDEEGLVICNDKSFVSDTVAYNRKEKTTTWLKELPQEEKDAYICISTSKSRISKGLFCS